MNFYKKVELTRELTGQKVVFVFEQEDKDTVAVYANGWKEGRMTIEKDIDDPESYAGWALYFPDLLFGEEGGEGTVYDADLSDAVDEIVCDLECYFFRDDYDSAYHDADCREKIDNFFSNMKDAAASKIER